MAQHCALHVATHANCWPCSQHLLQASPVLHTYLVHLIATHLSFTPAYKCKQRSVQAGGEWLGCYDTLASHVFLPVKHIPSFASADGLLRAATGVPGNAISMSCGA